jgi:hypothetical protein
MNWLALAIKLFRPPTKPVHSADGFLEEPFLSFQKSA